MVEKTEEKKTTLLDEDPQVVYSQHTRYLGGDVLQVNVVCTKYAEDYTTEDIVSVEIVDEFDKWHDVVAGKVTVFTVKPGHILEVRDVGGAITPYVINQGDEAIVLEHGCADVLPLPLVVNRGQAWREWPLGKDKKK